MLFEFTTAGGRATSFQVRTEDGLLLIKGAVPGHNGAFVIVRPAVIHASPAAKSSK